MPNIPSEVTHPDRYSYLLDQGWTVGENPLHLIHEDEGGDATYEGDMNIMYVVDEEGNRTDISEGIMKLFFGD